MEIWDGQWHIFSSADVEFYLDGQQITDHILENGQVLQGRALRSAVQFSLLSAAFCGRTLSYTKYCISGKNRLAVGSGGSADIRLHGSYVSDCHAVLELSAGQAVLTDHSTNGTYVNGVRIRQPHPLALFDEIYMAGFKMVYLGGLLAVNRRQEIETGLEAVRDGARFFLPVRPQPDTSLFVCSPRVIAPLDDEPVEIEAPPSPQKPKKQPLLFILGPSLTMPLPILTSVMFNMRRTGGTADPSMYLGTLLAVGMSAVIGGLWTVARQLYDKKSLRQEEKVRTEAYRAYISKYETLLSEKHAHNKQLLGSQYLSVLELFSIFGHNRTPLWNRNVNHPDYLAVRLGKGKVEYPGKIGIPKDRFSVADDELSTEPYRIYQTYRYMEPTVSLFSLSAHKIIGVIGEPERMGPMVNNLVMQLAALHPYTNLRLAFLLGEQPMEWVKWLPHTFTAEHKVRLVANDALSRQNVLYHLANELHSRQMLLEEEEHAPGKPSHYVVFCSSPDYINGEALYKYMTDEQDYQFTFVLLYGQLSMLPNECVSVIECGEEFCGRYLLSDIRRPADRVDFDQVPSDVAEQFARRMSGFYIRELASGEIPPSIEFLEMYGLANVRQWDLARHWKQNRTYESMRALVGIGSGGKPLYLDIHEKQHGPHGLVAGTTGSGKSETLQTYILSLAMNYHPDELAFILIDYKGGGMAGVFENLAHLAGVITNLDGNQTRRALVSIKSEIKRRQAVFKAYKINHIDAYARLYREGKADEPIPHLIMISDEFAELKKEQPEFIKELVSAARVGRSLGVHLILATQKPSGVVDDEIWSNSRFKICLHVQDRQDSNEMLKRPDAAYLTHTGRAYLQIGNDEIFEMFQSGYSGAAYEPKEQLSASGEDEVRIINLDGSDALVHSRKAKKEGNPVTQLDAMIAHIAEMAQKLQIKPVRQLWLPELPKSLCFEQLLSMQQPEQEQEGVCVPFGMADDPEHQQQTVLWLNLNSIGNWIIAGTSGCGKSTFLQTILSALAIRYKPEQVVFYCIDLSSRLLRVFNGLPHCGGVLYGDEDEPIVRLFQLLDGEMARRSALFEAAGVGSYNEYIRSGAESIPHILLVIDNYAAYAEENEERENGVARISREGNKYGIHVAVTLNHMNDMKFKIRQNFGLCIPLRLNDKGEYSEALGRMPEFIPNVIEGRGLYAAPEILEFQTALPAPGEGEKERLDILNDRFSGIIREYAGGYHAAPIPRLPRDEDYSSLLKRCRQSKADGMPLGYQPDTIAMRVLDLKKTFCFSVSDAEREGSLRFMQNVSSFAADTGAILHIAAFSPVRQDVWEKQGTAGVYRDSESLRSFLVELRAEFKNRSDARKSCQGEAGRWEKTLAAFSPWIVVIDSMNELCELLQEEAKGEMEALLETLFLNGAGLGIYFFAGFDTAIYQKHIYRQVVKRFINYRTGIHFGGHFDQQKLFECSLPMSQQMKRLDPEYGCLFEGHSETMLFIPEAVQGTSV
ncbi:MAG: type VII secretion protein EssC [Provencibacterium sp.]|nr:type VII secretion protein EssC [Provencibacterium sp.]